MNFDWSYTFGLLKDGDFWKASLTVVELSVLSWIIACLFGLGLALMSTSSSRVLRIVSGIYVWFFRSLPLLVLLIFLYNLPQIVSSTRVLLGSAFAVGAVAMVLNESAFMAEVHRGGLLSVSKDQREAASALGLPYGKVQRHVVIPQAFRIALPGLGNEFINILKLTSLVSSISLTEILLVGQRLYTQNFKVLETLTAVAIYYILLVTVFDLLRRYLERRLDVTGRKTELRDVDAPRTAAQLAVRRETLPHEGEKLVEVDGVRKAYGEHVVLDDVDLDVHRGEVVVIIGPSGSGKTTLLRTLNHLETVDGGSVRVNGELMGYRLDGNDRPQPVSDRQVAKAREHVGMVFQKFNLFPHLTVMQNMVLAPKQLGRTISEDEVHDLLDRVGMKRHASKYPHQLSGGQQQRVAIARAMAMHPDVLLFDEPTSALDPEMVGEVLQVIASLAEEKRTMVIVTHEMRVARDVADWVVFMEDGRVVAQGHPEEVLGANAPERTRRFLAAIGSGATASA